MKKFFLNWRWLVAIPVAVIIYFLGIAVFSLLFRPIFGDIYSFYGFRLWALCGLMGGTFISSYATAFIFPLVYRKKSALVLIIFATLAASVQIAYSTIYQPIVVSDAIPLLVTFVAGALAVACFRKSSEK